MLEQICPIFPSRDFDVTEDFYGKLGFTTWFRQDNQYLLMNRDKVEIHFFYQSDGSPASSIHAAYMRPSDVDELSNEIKELNLPVDGAPPRFAPAEDKPWGMREATLFDPDGNLLRIGQEIT